ncbi:MAG TPA: hypothetical protein VF157_16070 [Chloroflexota bacterium]
MTQWLLLHLSWWQIAAIFAVAPVPIAMAGLALVRRRVDPELLLANNEEGGVIFAIVGTIYAILLAFLVVVAWENLGAADKNVAEEAATVVALYRDTHAFPPEVATNLQAHIRDYTDAVIGTEWDTMAYGRESPEAHDRLNALWSAFTSINSTSAPQAYTEAFSELNTLTRDRELRLYNSRAEIPTLFWAFLMPGGILIVGFTYFFGMKNGHVQLAFTGVLAFTVGATLFLIVTLDHPFTGDVRVQPDAFVAALSYMDR